MIFARTNLPGTTGSNLGARQPNPTFPHFIAVVRHATPRARAGGQPICYRALMMMTKKLFALGAFIVIAAMSAHAADDPATRRLAPVAAHAMSAADKVNLDGKLDEPFWSNAAPINAFQAYRPREEPAKVKTEARIAFDGAALYIGIIAYDPNPEKIEAPLVRRDQVFGSQDFMAIHVDPVGTRKFAQIFRVNAAGSVGDGLYSEDNGNEDFSPDFEWEAATHRRADGWSAELRIPFSTLRYASPPAQNWSIQIVRGIAREETFRIANGRVPRDGNCQMCFAQTLSGMTNIPDGREFRVTPNITMRTSRDRETGRATVRASEAVVGVDLKYRPTPNWVIDATINPDFSQVELDSPQLAANAQFALFFPEKRPFFLEGADILSAPQNAIYTRSIGDPAWGVRATTRGDGGDFTILAARDVGKGLTLLPGSLGNGAALQNSPALATIMRGHLVAGAATWGALLTDRRAERGPTLQNTVVGADVVWRPTGELRTGASLLFSDTKDEQNKINGKTHAQDTSAVADYNYRTDKLSLGGGVRHVGADYRADSGFATQTGYTGGGHEIRLRFQDSWGFNEIAPYLSVEYNRSAAGQLLYQQNNIGVYASYKKTEFGFEARPNQRVRFRTEGKPLKRDQFYGWVAAQPGGIVPNLYAEAAIGDRADVPNNRMGRGYYVSANATIRVGDRWEIEPRIEDSAVDTREKVIGAKRIVHERAVQVASVYHFTARDNLRAIFQYGGVRRTQALFESRVAPLEKSEVASLVYGHRRGLGTNFYVGLNASRALEPQSGYGRRIVEAFVKASYSFDVSTW